jgi:hypothetical protein
LRGAVQQDVGFALNAWELRRIWPSQQTMEDFTRFASQRHVRLIIREYFDQIEMRADLLQRDIRRLVQLATAALVDVRETMVEYNRSMVIKGEFVRY